MTGRRGPVRPVPGDDPFFDLDRAASCTECTGALPAQVETAEEKRNIAELGAIHPPKND